MSRWSVDGCPSEDVVAAYVADELEAVDRELLEEHLDGCSGCHAVVAEWVRVFAASHADAAAMPAPLGSSDTLEGSARPGGGAAVALGTSIGRYRVLKLLGMGGMGVVYAAHDPQLDRTVALKVLRVRPQTDATEHSARLLREARAMAKLSHPNVIAVHDVGTWEGQVFVAMEFVAGGTLKDWVAGHERTWSTLWPVLHAAGLGLAAAHAAGFVHRDFKPDNVLLSPEDRVFVTDFGLARWDVDAPASRGAAATMHTLHDSAGESGSGQTVPDGGGDAGGPAVALTRSGAFVGTPAYMAPEQFRRGAVDAACDQFAFCVVVWEALFSARPFVGRTLAMLAQQVTCAELPALPATPAVPRRVRAALIRGLAKDPADRFPSMDELLRELAPQTRARTGWAAGAGALALGVPLTVWALVPGASDPTPTAICERGHGPSPAWQASQRDRLREAFATSDAVHAPATGRRVIEKLDTYADDWASAQLQVCEGAASGDLEATRAGLRRRCLERSAVMFETMVEGLAEATPRMVDAAVRIVGRLPDLQACQDDERLDAELPPVPPAEQAEQVEAVRAALLRADAQYALGRYEEGLAGVDEVRASAEALAFRPLTADVEYMGARLLLGLGRNKDAVVALERAELLGTAARHGRVVAKSLILQIYAKAQRGDPWEALQPLIARATAESEAASLDHSERGSLHTNIAAAAYYNDLLERAEAESEKALALVSRTSDPLRWAAATSNLAQYQRRRGAVESAIPAIREVLEVYISELGRAHPEVAETYRGLAISLKNLERFEEAYEAVDAALSILADTLGEEHYLYGGTLATRSGIEGAAMDYERAVQTAQRSSQILKAAGQSTQIPDALRAEWLISLKRPDEAAPVVDAILAAEIERNGADSPSLSWIYFVRCSLEAARKDVDATREACDVAIRLAAAEPQSEAALSMRLDRAVHLAQAGGNAEALEDLEAVLPELETSAQSPTTARIYRELGEQAGQVRGRETQARAWVAKARAQFEALEMSESEQDAAAWLREHT